MLTLLSRLLMAVSLLVALAPNALADDYPNRPVRLIIPFPPGGSNDVVGRLVGSLAASQSSGRPRRSARDRQGAHWLG